MKYRAQFKILKYVLLFITKLKTCHIERFSNECRKTKTKVIILANHNKNKLPNEPIRTRSKYM